MSGLLQRLKNSRIAELASKWGELRATDGATLIAWQLLFSLFPLVLGMLSILGLVLRSPDRLASVAQAIAGQFPAGASDLVGFITETRDYGGILGIISIVGLLWSGSNLFGVTASVFNRFYGAPDRGTFQQRLVDFTVMIVYAVMLTISVGAASITGILVGISEQVLRFQVPYFAFVLGWVISFTAAFVMFLILYRVIPNVSLSFRHVWPGALLAATLFVVLALAFPIYLRLLGGGFAAYKALGVFLLLMTWFYFLGMILVAGALFNAILTGDAAKAEPATEAGMSATETRRSHSRHRRRAPAPAGGQAAAPRTDAETPFKVVAWAGLGAAVSSLILISARAVAARIWRTIVGEEPPGS